MKNINELLRNSEIRTAILTIANDLISDENYSKEEAAEELLELLYKHNL
ncbi:hypothetical protein [Metabacillus bambusae]|uniref:Fur-regulated basic protein FbpA n=1 Tax=Metabacillus bambusae TaxID=2795218 RepID=A0ABS3NC98_9BACI|nr:hypothetical protein [Metabacillus bambusae]MBO1515681.1 hypothetical protein [Metabacillus bambusae]